MNHIPDRSFDRILWRDGDRLTATDLQAEVLRDRLLRSLHVGRLHGTSGIAFGLDVRVGEQPGGRKQVAVGAGYAIDQQGRDLILPTGMVLDIPVTPQTTIFVLCAAVAPVAHWRAMDAPAMDGIDPRIERAAFVWGTARDAPFADEVPLIALRARNGVLEGALDPSVRRTAQRAARPHIASGMTDLGATDWQLSNDAASAELVVRIDTVEAGFSSPPVYAARIMMSQEQARFWSELTAPPLDPTRVAPMQGLAAVEAGYIVECDRTFFEYRLPVMFPRMVARARAGWAIGWEGIEPLPDDSPQWSALDFYTLTGLRLPMSHLSISGVR